jgi:glycosyltransferase involved in cell wall biosynthesis
LDVLKGFDVIIAHNVLTMPYNLPLCGGLHRIAQDGVIPIISWNHDSPYFYPDYPEHLDLFPWNMLKRAYAGIYYVAISDSRRKMFAKLYGRRKHLYMIPNGIDPIRFFKLNPLTVRLIREEDLFGAEFIMVQPSRLIPRKNMELSIRVTAELQGLGIGAKLLITGAHDPHEPKSLRYYNKLRKLARSLGIEKDVIIIAEHRFSSGEKLESDRIIIRDLYLISDILFLPSLQEGFGIPLLEAGMIKLPIVCSSIPPFKEIGGNDICTFELDESPRDIALKIKRFASRLIPHRMFRKVISNYAWDNIYHRQLLPLLNKIIRKG